MTRREFFSTLLLALLPSARPELTKYRYFPFANNGDYDHLIVQQLVEFPGARFEYSDLYSKPWCQVGDQRLRHYNYMRVVV